MAKILIVEDDQNNLKYASMLLEDEGHTTLSAEDGVSALALLEKEDVDVVVLDVKLPELDGVGVMERLKKIRRTKKLPVIVVTAYDEYRCYFSQENVVAFIDKPYTEEELLNAVDSVTQLH